ncbi:MAG: ribonuclease Z [Lachnospiraceae bacterium]|nr:ribonuclease Z [Lachnospiraceae bacterium]
MLEVCLLGTSGMMPLPRRALTALMTRYNGSSLLIDCGEGTQVSIRTKGWSFHPIDTICFTHFHGDHISGLPGLLLSMGNAERKDPLTLIGPKGLEKVVKSLLVIAPGLPFPIRYIELTEDFQIIENAGYQIEAFRVNHNVTCYGYNLVIHRAGKFSPEKAKENEVPMKLWSRLQKGENIELAGKLFTPDMVLGEARKGLKITYCTDTRPTNSLVTHAKEADLLICEGMYGEKDMEKKAKEHKHMTFYEAADIARKAKVQELWLTHYSPSLIYPEQYMEDVRKLFPHSWAGKDRKTVDLNFEKEGSDE